MIVGCGGGNGPSSSQDTVLIYKSTEAVQCGFEGFSIDDTANELIEAGVDVLLSQCGITTGLIVATVCGAGTFDINIHEIPAQNIEDAEDLEFSQIEDLIDEEAGVGYQTTDCND